MPERQPIELPEEARLSDAQYGEIFASVHSRLGDVAAGRRRRAGALLASGLSVVVLGVFWSELNGSATQRAAVQAKGDNAVSTPRGAPLIEMGCGGPSQHFCGFGDTLTFAVTGVTRPAFLVAYAQRSKALSEEKVWYFGGLSGRRAPLDVDLGTQVLPMGVRLAAPHQPGVYDVVAWVAESETVDNPPDTRGSVLRVQLSVSR